MSNKYDTDIERFIRGSVENIEQGRCIAIEALYRISHSKITIRIEKEYCYKRYNNEDEEEEDEH